MVLSLQVNVRMVFLSVGMGSHEVGVNQTKQNIQFLPERRFHLVQNYKETKIFGSVRLLFENRIENQTKPFVLHYTSIL